MLADVLGYDKYNELKTEMREKNGRLDYIVKLSDGPNAKKKDTFDFVIEAKAAHINLNENHINQTLQYCLTKGVDYFILTNAVKWELYFVRNTKRDPGAILVHEVNFSVNNDIDSLTEEFYLFSKNSYVSGDWKNVHTVKKATKTEDVVAVLLSDKVTRVVAKELASIHDVKITPEQIKDIIENDIVKAEVSDINKRLLKKINDKPKSKKKKDTNTEESNVLEFKKVDEAPQSVSDSDSTEEVNTDTNNEELKAS